MEIVRSCLARIGCLTLLVAGAAGTWYFQDDVRAWWASRAAVTVDAEPSREIADRAETRLLGLLEADGEAEVRLAESEVASLVRFRVAERLPAGVSDPAVALGDTTARATALLDVPRLLEGRVPPMLTGMLGDSARITVELLPSVPEPGAVRLGLMEVRAGALQVPPMMIPWLLDGLGLPAAPDASSAVQFAVPVSDLTHVRVQDRHLVLIRSGSPPSP